MNFLVTGIGAGLVSALLTAVIVKSTPLASLLYLLAPIPILIVSLGWDHRSGLVAAVVGGGAIALVLSPLSGLGFALVTALPAWWLAYLALLGRVDSAGVTEWYPLGRLLAWIAGTAALTIIATALISVGSYEAFYQNAQEIAESFVNSQFPTSDQDGLDPEMRRQLISGFARLTPFLSAQGFTVILALYLWTAAKIVALSGRLPRPWPSVPELIIPKPISLLLVAAFALAVVPGFAGAFGMALIGALFMAFALQGLAAIHERTRGKSARAFLLTSLYLLVFLSQGVLMVALSIFGIADTVFDLRRRFRSREQRSKFPPTSST